MSEYVVKPGKELKSYGYSMQYTLLRDHIQELEDCPLQKTQEMKEQIERLKLRLRDIADKISRCHKLV